MPTRSRPLNPSQEQAMSAYYQDKLPTLKEVFGTPDVTLADDSLSVRGKRYPIVHDVIVLLEPAHYTAFVAREIQTADSTASQSAHEIAADIQYSFGEEWKSYSAILAEHQREFSQYYFDIVDLDSLRGKRVCDLGCGCGRWSYFLKDRCQSMILVDFSDAIFAARSNLADADNCLFFMGDLQRLPFADDFADFLFSLGVLHHLPSPCLDEVRKLRRAAPQLLVYLYYALDNRPIHFRALLRLVTILRRSLAKVRSPRLRRIVTEIGTYFIYMPLICLGHLLKPVGLNGHVPLYAGYYDKGIQRIKQDVYDRFFTSIEQRVTRKEIQQLRDTFSEVRISDRLGYWHFLCER
jgi:SAM-dependent methyltransferase